jgi:hypothetical protein
MAFTLTDAIEFATLAHEGQVDKLGQPYIEHPLRVMESLECHGEMVQMVGVLHDILEDTGYTTDDLLDMGVEPEVVFTLVALARQEGESYDDFISRIIAYGEWAITVKIADIYDNTTPARLELLELPTKERLMRRYFPAMDRLLEAVGA